MPIDASAVIARISKPRGCNSAKNSDVWDQLTATRWTLDDLITHYLADLEGQGRELRTRIRYEGVAKLWISPVIGSKAARRISADDIDRCFAEMRRAGQSASSMNQAKALPSGAFKWARRTGKAIHNPLLDFQLPKSRHVQREKLPPEADEISLILKTAWEQTPDIAPILTLAATTGARLGELVAPRASDIDWARGMLAITSAADVDGSPKETKRAHHRGEVPLDDGTLEVLRRQVDNPAARVVFFDIPTPEDPFLFSREVDSSRPMIRERRRKASVQPFIQRVSEVHLERASRYRIQPQRGRTTARGHSPVRRF